MVINMAKFNNKVKEAHHRSTCRNLIKFENSLSLIIFSVKLNKNLQLKISVRRTILKTNYQFPPNKNKIQI